MNRKLRKLSSEPDGFFLRAAFNQEQLRWWRENWHQLPPCLNEPGRTELVEKRGPLSVVLEHDRVAACGDFAWVKLRTDRVVPCVRINLGNESYNVFDAYRVARRKLKPRLSPHGSFRSLSYRDHSQAVEFMARFGPLLSDCREHFLRSSLVPEWFSGWVNLDDFWKRQLRFTLISRLYEALSSRGSEAKLRRAWEQLLCEGENNDLGPLRRMPTDGSSGGAYSGQPDEEWIKAATPQELRIQAIALIQRELNKHAGKGSAWPFWAAETESQAFHPTLMVDSLWAAIWQLFGLDTSTERPWRVCPHCFKLFYPPRKDRLYCTTRVQELYSKRRWWEENRAVGRK